MNVMEKEEDLKKKFRAGIYCRISVEEAEKKDIYSNSIQTQMQMAEAYIEGQEDVQNAGTYVDDGVSGSSFTRPGFSRLLADIALEKINMIVVKDISRIGREHIFTGYYLGIYFPKRSVRVRSLLENYDSKENLYNEILDIKMLFNDMYLRDISLKTRSVIQMKRRMGEYTAKDAPYGYRKSKKFPNHLETDAYAAEVVRKICRMYLDGYGCTAISKNLNQEGILPPGRYKKEVLHMAYPYTTGRGVWTASSVNKILKNPVYTGAVVVKKTEKTSYKSEHRKEIPLSHRELCRAAHEPILEAQQFWQVQKIRENRKVSHLSIKQPSHKYTGLLYCGKCGYRMQKHYRNAQEGYDGYICSSYQTLGEKFCEQSFITFVLLDALVLFAIGQQVKHIENLEEVEEKIITKCNLIDEKRGGILQRKIEKKEKDCQEIYEKYMDNILTKDEYIKQKKVYEEEREQCDTERKRLYEKMKKKKNIFQKSRRWIRGIGERQLSREILKEFVKKIELYPDKTLEIYFWFEDQKNGDGGEKSSV